MKQFFLLLICFGSYSLKGCSGPSYLLDNALVLDTIPIVVDSKSIIADSSLFKNPNNYNGGAKYDILYPSTIDHHIVIAQQTQKKMHIRLLNIGGQVLREQWTKALETDLYVKNLKGLFIVEIEYEGGVFSKTVVIQ